MILTVGQHTWYPSNGPDRFDPHLGFEGCSKYYGWCVELGYPNVDVVEFADKEWGLIEFYTSPTVPSMTRWNYVLHGLRNILITPGIVERFLHSFDLRRKEVWAAEEAKSQHAEAEHAKVEEHAQETAKKMTDIILATPTLLDRFVKEGAHALSPEKMIQNIPAHQRNGLRNIETKTISSSMTNDTLDKIATPSTPSKEPS